MKTWALVSVAVFSIVVCSNSSRAFDLDKWKSDLKQKIEKSVKDAIEKSVDGNAGKKEPPASPQQDTASNSLNDKALIRKIQRNLNAHGYNAGSPDGIFGARTAQAIRAYQEKTGLTIDGKPSKALLSALQGDALAQKKTTSSLGQPVATNFSGGQARFYSQCRSRNANKAHDCRCLAKKYPEARETVISSKGSKRAKRLSRMLINLQKQRDHALANGNTNFAKKLDKNIRIVEQQLKSTAVKEPTFTEIYTVIRSECLKSSSPANAALKSKLSSTQQKKPALPSNAKNAGFVESQNKFYESCRRTHQNRYYDCRCMATKYLDTERKMVADKRRRALEREKSYILSNHENGLRRLNQDRSQALASGNTERVKRLDRRIQTTEKRIHASKAKIQALENGTHPSLRNIPFESGWLSLQKEAWQCLDTVDTLKNNCTQLPLIEKSVPTGQSVNQYCTCVSQTAQRSMKQTKSPYKKSYVTAAMSYCTNAK